MGSNEPWQSCFPAATSTSPAPDPTRALANLELAPGPGEFRYDRGERRPDDRIDVGSSSRRRRTLARSRQAIRPKQKYAGASISHSLWNDLDRLATLRAEYRNDI